MSKTLIAVLAVYIGGIGGALLFDAAWAVYIYEINYFLNPTKRWWYSTLPDISYSFIISVVMLFTFFIRYGQYSKNRWLDLPPFRWLICFFLLMILVTPIAVWPEMHEKYLIIDLKAFVILAVAYKIIDTPQKFSRLIWAYLIGAFYISYISWDFGRTGAGRLEGLGPIDAPDANGMAAVLASVVPLLLFYCLRAKKLFQKGFAALALAFVLNAIILVNSRGAFLGLIVSCSYMLFFFLISRREPFGQKAIIIMGICVSIGMFFYLTDDVFWERMSTLQGIDVDVSASGKGGGDSRVYYWMKTFDVLKDYPLGAGGRGYTYLSPNYLPPEMLTGGMRSVHSTVFQVLAEFGYLGFVLFSGVVFSVFRLAWKARTYLKARDGYLYYKIIGLESGFLAFLTAALFIDRLHTTTLYWSMLFIMVFFNVYIKNSHNINETH